MTTRPEVTPSPGADQQLSRATRMTLVALGCLALALGGAGAAYAGSLGDGADGDTADEAWVTVVEDDGTNRTVDCPRDKDDTDGDGL